MYYTVSEDAFVDNPFERTLSDGDMDSHLSTYKTFGHKGLLYCSVERVSVEEELLVDWGASVDGVNFSRLKRIPTKLFQRTPLDKPSGKTKTTKVFGSTMGFYGGAENSWARNRSSINLYSPILCYGKPMRQLNSLLLKWNNVSFRVYRRPPHLPALRKTDNNRNLPEDFPLIFTSLPGEYWRVRFEGLLVCLCL